MINIIHRRGSNIPKACGLTSDNLLKYLAIGVFVLCGNTNESVKSVNFGLFRLIQSRTRWFDLHVRILVLALRGGEIKSP